MKTKKSPVKTGESMEERRSAAVAAATTVKFEKKSNNRDSDITIRNRYEDVTVKCEFCIEVFNTSKDYYDHANQEHPREVVETWVPCKQCHARLPTAIALSSHNAKVHSKAELRDSSGT